MNLPPATVPFRGIIPPLVTPLREDQSFDPAALVRLIDHVLCGGVHGLFILGTTGEAPSLPIAVRREVIAAACAAAGDRAPVLVGISSAPVPESLALARFAAEHGAAAVVLTSPDYYALTQAQLAHHVERIAARVELPILLYNIPSCSRTAFAPETVRKLIELPNIVGLKDSSGDPDALAALTRAVTAVPGRTMLVGPEAMLAQAVRDGAHGGICGGANLLPTLFASLYDAALRADDAAVNELQSDVLTLAALYQIRPGADECIASLKAALSILGICGPTPAEPFEPMNEHERKRVEEVTTKLERWLPRQHCAPCPLATHDAQHTTQ